MKTVLPQFTIVTKRNKINPGKLSYKEVATVHRMYCLLLDRENKDSLPWKWNIFLNDISVKETSTVHQRKPWLNWFQQ